jgi:hypothetical protein
MFKLLVVLFTQINIKKETTMIDMLKRWTIKRLKERTTLDGVVLIGAGLAYLVLKPVAVFVSYAAIAYGIWTLWKKES